MKKVWIKRIGITILPLFIVGMLIFSGGCTPDTDIDVVILVKRLDDTTQIVPNAQVELSRYDVLVSGTTNESGIFTHTFELESILDITVVADDPGNPQLIGTGVIRLKPGRTMYKTIFVSN